VEKNAHLFVLIHYFIYMNNVQNRNRIRAQIYLISMLRLGFIFPFSSHRMKLSNVPTLIETNYIKLSCHCSVVSLMGGGGGDKISNNHRKCKYSFTALEILILFV
jgi:hypothetical protein